MLFTIPLLIGVVFVVYAVKFFLERTEAAVEKEPMADQEQRCSSSESDNFEKIDSEEAREDNGNPNFTVGDVESDSGETEDEPAHEGRDSFPNVPPPNIRRHLTPAQQLALAEKRAKLK